MDQWEVAPLLVKAHEGTLSSADLLAQQNESRILFPRLLFLGVAGITGWNARAEMLLPFLMACGSAAAIWRLDRTAAGGSRAASLGRLALASLLLFGPIQYENWFWGHQAVVFAPVACLLGLLLVARGGLGPRGRVAAAAALALVATFSFASGALLWVLGALALLLAMPAALLPRRTLALAWGTAAAAALAVYAVGYHRPPAQPAPNEAPGGVLDLPSYFLALLGSPLGQGIGHAGVGASAAAGAVLLALLGAAAAFILRRRSDAALLGRTWPFLLLAAYSLGTAALTTFGRGGNGTWQALSPRYATASVLLPVSLVFLLPAVLAEAATGGRCSLTPARAAALGAALATAAVFAHLLASSRAMLRAENWRVRRLEARAALAFLDVAPDEPCLTVNVYPDLALLRERAHAVDALGLLRPALVRPGDLPRLLAGAPDPSCGFFNDCSPRGDAVRCSGKARLPGRGEPPDAVLVGCIGEDGAPRVLALAQAVKIRVTSLPPPTADFWRQEDWECRIPLAAIPAGTRALRAWAYDALEGRAIPLPGAPALPGTAGGR
jgi:hypothetical protein